MLIDNSVAPLSATLLALRLLFHIRNERLGPLIVSFARRDICRQ